MNELEKLDDKLSEQVKEVRKTTNELFEGISKKSFVFAGDGMGNIMVVYSGIQQVGSIPLSAYMSQIL